MVSLSVCEIEANFSKYKIVFGLSMGKISDFYIITAFIPFKRIGDCRIFYLEKKNIRTKSTKKSNKYNVHTVLICIFEINTNPKKIPVKSVFASRFIIPEIALTFVKCLETVNNCRFFFSFH